jgi:hypothetical protein
MPSVWKCPTRSVVGKPLLGNFIVVTVTNRRLLANSSIEARSNRRFGTFLYPLPLTDVRTRLMGVRLGAKVGVSLLAMLLGALPVMACTVPGVTMTAAERDCCKRMAERCGHSSMAKSHGCCQPQASPSRFEVLKSCSFQLNVSLVDFHIQPAMFRATGESPLLCITKIASAPHGPPGLSSVGTTVLRI